MTYVQVYVQKMLSKPDKNTHYDYIMKHETENTYISRKFLKWTPNNSERAANDVNALYYWRSTIRNALTMTKTSEKGSIREYFSRHITTTKQNTRTCFTKDDFGKKFDRP